VGVCTLCERLFTVPLSALKRVADAQESLRVSPNTNARAIRSAKATAPRTRVNGVRHMTLDDFRQSLTQAEPPAELTLALAGLWWDAKGDWTSAHESVEEDESLEGSWVHAYFIAKKAIRETLPIGTDGRESLFAKSH